MMLPSKSCLTVVMAVVAAVSCSSKKSDETSNKQPAKQGKSQPPTSPNSPKTAPTPPTPPRAKAVDVVCDDVGKLAASMWNADAKQKLKTAFVSSAVVHAVDTLQRVSARLDTTTKQLTASATPQCALVKHLCLTRRARAMGALVTALTQPKQRSVERALRAVYRLAPVSDCADAEYMASRPQPPKADQHKLEQLYAHIDRLRIALHLGRSKGALLELKAVVMGAQRVGYPSALSEARALQARAYRVKGKLTHAQQSLRFAAKTATLAQDHWLVADAWIELVSVLVDAKRLKDALRVVKGAELAIARSKNTRVLKRRLQESLAMVHFQSGQYSKAIDATAAAVALVDGHDDIAAAGILFLRAAAMQADNKLGAAETVYAKLQDTVTKAFGPLHPMVGRVLIARGQAQVALKRLDDGIKTIRAAVDLFEKSYGASHLHVASGYSTLARALATAKKYRAALAVHAKVLVIRTKAGGPAHRSVARTHLEIARTLRESGDTAKAVTSAQKARKVFETAKSKAGVAAVDKFLKQLAAP